MFSWSMHPSQCAMAIQSPLPSVTPKLRRRCARSMRRLWGNTGVPRFWLDVRCELSPCHCDAYIFGYRRCRCYNRTTGLSPHPSEARSVSQCCIDRSEANVGTASAFLPIPEIAAADISSAALYSTARKSAIFRGCRGQCTPTIPPLHWTYSSSRTHADSQTAAFP